MSTVRFFRASGGWPMTVVLTPDRQPFFAGSYFPPRDGDRGAGVGLLTVLKKLADLYASEPDQVVAKTRQVTEGMQALAKPSEPGDVPGHEAIEKAAGVLLAGFDSRNGGLGRAPKFPLPSTLELLLRYQRRSGHAKALEAVVVTLEKMAAGGIWDQVGGGFHRYATDDEWLVPHFEKMLYDNAQLAVVYLEAFQATGRKDFAEIARRTLDYLDLEMSDPGGGFASATDADSPVPGSNQEEEGWFFTWTPPELVAALGKDRAGAVGAYYGVTDAGHLYGRSILHIAASVEAVARSLGVPPNALASQVEEARPILYQARIKRPPPARDDKIIAAWNGLAISAFARGGQVLREPRFTVRAARAADFVLREMRQGPGLLRTWKDGQARHVGTLEDYAFVAHGLLDLYEASHDSRWLAEALALHGVLAERFLDDAGGFFRTPHEHEALLARDKPDDDGAEPSGNSVAILDLLRLAELTSEDRFRAAAVAAFSAFSRQLTRGAGTAKMLTALDFHLDTPLEIVLVGRTPGATGTLEAVLHRTFVPNHVLVVATEGADLAGQQALVPLLESKTVLKGNATAFVCRRRTCAAPTSDPAVFARQISL
jgi:uncharacterized protein YyaL (SSP411 family)